MNFKCRNMTYLRENRSVLAKGKCGPRPHFLESIVKTILHAVTGQKIGQSRIRQMICANNCGGVLAAVLCKISNCCLRVRRVWHTSEAGGWEGMDTKSKYHTMLSKSWITFKRPVLRKKSKFYFLTFARNSKSLSQPTLLLSCF